jgi:hypothetical protein
VLVGGKLLLGDGEAARTACARVLARGGTDEKTGEVLSAAVAAERVAWCAALPPTIPPAAVLHLPTLQVTDGRVRAGVPFTCAVPAARRDGHTTALGVDWGLTTLLSAGAARLHPDGTITALGAGFHLNAHATPPRWEPIPPTPRSTEDH